MRLSSVFGHDSAVRALQRALQADQLAGTYLFAGPQGVGKTTLALAFGASAACLSPRRDPFDACGECDSCRRAITGSHPEIVLISPAGDQTQIWQFWDRDGKPAGILQHSLHYAPTIGRKRVYIIERADTLNESAANSLLKALEEPPPYVVFVLLTPHPGRLLPTILSRTQVVRLTPSPVDSVAHYLCTVRDILPEKARAYAAFAEGRVGAAISMARSPGVEAELGGIIDLAMEMQSASPLGALKAAESLRKRCSVMKALTGEEGSAEPPNAGEDDPGAGREKLGRKQLGLGLDLLMVVYRDLLVLNLTGTAAAITIEDRRDPLDLIARSHATKRWMSGLEDLLSARRRLDQNANIRLLTDWLVIRLVLGGSS